MGLGGLGIGGGSAEMKWNPIRQKWEGNEIALRVFENSLNSSTRPALISPLSAPNLISSNRAAFGTSHANPNVNFGLNSGSKGKSSALGQKSNHPMSTSSLKTAPSTSTSNQTSTVGGARVVGDMIFDPIKMTWLSKPGRIEEPDVFEQMELDDPEDLGATLKGKGKEKALLDSTEEVKGDLSWRDKVMNRPRFSSPATGFGGEEDTETGSLRSINRARASTGTSSVISVDWEGGSPNAVAQDNAEEDGEEEVELQLQLQHQNLIVMEDEELKKNCLEAEKRHRREVRGFLPPTSRASKTKTSKETSASKEDSNQEQLMINRQRQSLYLLQRLARQAIR